jgi:hypothetical protein
MAGEVTPGADAGGKAEKRAAAPAPTNQAPSWEEMVNQVIVLGRPANLEQAALGWEQLLINIHSVITNLQQNVRDLKTHNIWSGPAYEAYAVTINALATRLTHLLNTCRGIEPHQGATTSIPVAIRDAAAVLTKYQEMPIPWNSRPEVAQARGQHTTIDIGAFKKVEVAHGWPYDMLAQLHDTFHNHTEQARTNYYIPLNAQTAPIVQQTPQANPARFGDNRKGPGSSIGGPDQPDSAHDSVGQSPGLQSFPSAAGGPVIPGDGSRGNSGHSSDAGSVVSRPDLIASSRPTASGAGVYPQGVYPWDEASPGPHTNDTPPRGSGLAGASVDSPGYPASAGNSRAIPLGGAANGGGYPRDLYGPNGINGGGSLGTPVKIPPPTTTPTGALPMGTSAGGSGSTGNQKKGRREYILTNRNRPFPDDDKQDHSQDWLYDDDNPWNNQPTAPPPVIGGRGWNWDDDD